jgi:DNA polymerase-3 subunit gamma/tau
LSLLEVSEAEATSLAGQSSLINAEVLTRVMEVLTESEGRLRDAASKKIFVEVALLKAIQARTAVSIDTVLKQLQQLRDEGNNASVPPAPLPPTRAAAPAGARSTDALRSHSVALDEPAPAPITAPAPSDVDLGPLWQNLLEAVGRASPFTRSYLNEAFPVSLANNVFTIGFDPEFGDKLDLVNNSKTHSILQTKLHELGHPKVQIKFVKQESPGPRTEPSIPLREEPTPPPAPTPDQAPSTGGKPRKDKVEAAAVNAEEFKNDPLIQKALEVFRGRIVEVRA